MTRNVPALFLLFLLGLFSPPGYSQASQSVTSLQDLPAEVLAYPEIVLFNGKILTVVTLPPKTSPV